MSHGCYVTNEKGMLNKNCKSFWSLLRTNILISHQALVQFHQWHFPACDMPSLSLPISCNSSAVLSIKAIKCPPKKYLNKQTKKSSLSLLRPKEGFYTKKTCDAWIHLWIAAKTQSKKEANPNSTISSAWMQTKDFYHLGTTKIPGALVLFWVGCITCGLVLRESEHH